MQNENGVLAVQEDFGNALVDKYAPVWDKKVSEQRRVYLGISEKNPVQRLPGCDDIA